MVPLSKAARHKAAGETIIDARALGCLVLAAICDW